MLFIFVAQGLNCPTYSCKLSGQNFNYQQCIYAGQSGYYISECTNGILPYCSPGQSNTTCTPVPAQSQLGVSWPGENCTSDANCAYGVCYNSTCNSLTYNMPCQTSDQCNPGFYCTSSLVCDFQIEVNKTGCNSDTDCVNKAGCNNGMCTEYFTLAPGTSVSSCINNINYLCRFATCNVSDSGPVCGSSVTSYNSTCQTSSDCVSSKDTVLGGTYQSGCLCSYSPGQANQTRSYCTQLPGDPNYSSYLMYLQKWLGTTRARLCNTSRRFSNTCISLHWGSSDSTSLVLNQLYITYYPMIKNNDNCTQSVYFQDYWTLANQVSLQKTGFLDK
jgi:hypothetical protein